METTTGTIDKVIFRNAQNGFAILAMRNGSPRKKFTVSGTFGEVRTEMDLEIYGEWVTHPKYGLQFRAESFSERLPKSTDGILAYLSSKMVQGIGPELAGAVVARFGEATFDVIENTPERLREVDGIGPKRSALIAERWARQKDIRRIMVFLKEHHVTDGLAVKIHRQYGADSIGVLEDNPYRLCREVDGVGFKTADTLARNLGVDPSSGFRIEQGLVFVLEDAAGEGHCFLPLQELVSRTAKELEVAPAMVTMNLKKAVASGVLIEERYGDTYAIYEPRIHQAEKAVAKKIAAMMHDIRPAGEPDFKAIEARTGKAYEEPQREAVRRALRRRISVTTGGPGTGKTTTLEAIILAAEVEGRTVVLASPTGRAAKRMEEATGRPAKTIHRLLEFKEGGFARCAGNPLEGDLLVVDEISMVDVRLMRSVLAAVPAHMSVLLVGDADQLPSIGPGSILKDLLTADVPSTHLERVFRHGERSGIAVAAHLINDGTVPESVEDGSDFLLSVTEPGASVVAEAVLQAVGGMLKSGIPVDDIQILSPMRENGEASAKAFNVAVQQMVNPAGQAVGQGRDGERLRVGDRIIHLRNNYKKDVYNGDIGMIRAFDEEDGTVEAVFDGRTVIYEADELDEVSLAYAVTIHKSQGSEYPHVVIPMTCQHYRLLQRNLLYTAVTRARRSCHIIGEMRAIETAVRNNSARMRYTRLAEIIRGMAVPAVAASAADGAEPSLFGDEETARPAAAAKRKTVLGLDENGMVCLREE